MNEENKEGPDFEPVEVTAEDFVDLETDGAETESIEAVVGQAEAGPDTFDDLTEETSVIDAGFVSAPAAAEPQEPEIIVEEVEDEDVVSSDGLPEEQAAGTEDPEETGIIRKSLFSPVVETTETEQAPVTQVLNDPVVTTQMSQQAPPDFASATGSDASLLEGATILPELGSRAGSRWLSAIAYILLVPLTWYLLADSGGRFLIATDAPWLTGTVNVAALGEFVGGLAVLILLAIVAAQSSLGLYIAGVAVTVIGTPFLFIPEWTAQVLASHVNPGLTPLGSLGNNIAYYLEFTGATGIMFATGIAMIASGWVVTYVRRAGRSEESLRAEVGEVNPDGLRARWARKATAAD